MHRVSGRLLFVTLMVAPLAFGAASVAVVGMATSNGEFTIDNARVPGTATLFDGSTVETGRVVSQVQIRDGARIQLGSETRGVFHRDRMVLEKGWTQVDGMMGYPVDALSLRVRGAKESKVRLTLGPDQVLQVAAFRGPVRVYKSSGMLVGSVAAGTAMAFSPQESGAAAASTITGCLEEVDGKVYITDETSQVRLEAAGREVAGKVGSRVQLVGAVESEEQVPAILRVSSIKPLQGKCPVRAMAAGGAGAAAPGGATPGGGARAATVGAPTKAIIAGVVVAGAVTGVVVAAVGDQPQAISPTAP